MNLIILDDNQWQSDRSTFVAQLNRRQQQHITQVLKVQPGDTLKVGKINGSMGEALVQQVNADAVTIKVDPSQVAIEAPPPSPVGLILALPRPKAVRRLLRTAAELGVKHIHLINSFRVEKSYWQSPLLSGDKLDEQFLLGLEQSGDTAWPGLTQHRRFKPFVEDTLPNLTRNTPGLVAHPSATSTLDIALENQLSKKDRQQQPRTWLAIGPEGGFIPYEIEKLKCAGFAAFNAGPRVMRTETAVPYLLAQLNRSIQA